MNVAIIDTGIHCKYLSSGIEIKKYKSLHIEQSHHQKYLCISDGVTVDGVEPSHGTNVINTIRKYSADTDISAYIYNIFDSENRSSGILIVESLKLILEEDIDIVVISLTCDSIYKSEFLQIKNIVLEKKLIILCAADNEGKNDFPASLDFIYGVGRADFTENGKYDYFPDAAIQFRTNCEYEFVGKEQGLSLFDGTSKGTAVIAGIMVNYLNKYGRKSLDEFLMQRHERFIKQSNQKEMWIDNEIFRRVLLAFGLKEDVDPYLLDVPISWSNENNVNSLLFLLNEFDCENILLNLNYRNIKTIKDIVITMEDIVYESSCTCRGIQGASCVLYD